MCRNRRQPRAEQNSFHVSSPSLQPAAALRGLLCQILVQLPAVSITGLSYTKSRGTKKKKQEKISLRLKKCSDSMPFPMPFLTGSPQSSGQAQDPDGATAVIWPRYTQRKFSYSFPDRAESPAWTEGRMRSGLGVAVIIAARCPSLACWVLCRQPCHFMARGPAHTTASWAPAHPSKSRIIINRTAQPASHRITTKPLLIKHKHAPN